MREDDHRLWAVRGAVRAERNEPEAILRATSELLSELIARNSLMAESMVSCIFTCTEDLDAEFPAVAARRLGLDAVPLICAREIPVPGSLGRIVRVLLHYYGPPDRPPLHSYLGEAQALRADLRAAQ